MQFLLINTDVLSTTRTLSLNQLRCSTPFLNLTQNNKFTPATCLVLKCIF